MKNSVVVFFFANNNHISNVKTLQSIYRQDYENINLIICNDSTYGFENERLLNNFEEYKGNNVHQIYFHENPYPLGEYRSLLQFLNRIDGEFIITMHSGECFITSTALRKCITNLLYDVSLDAILVDAEQWTSDLTQPMSVDSAIEAASNHIMLDNTQSITYEKIRDCMVIYRLSVLRNNQFMIDNHYTHISQCIIQQLIKEGKRVVYMPMKLCKYSNDSVQDRTAEIPAEFGNVTLKNIERLLQKSEKEERKQENILFQSAIEEPPQPKKNLNLILYNLSSFVRIKSYAIIALLLFIAAGMFLNMDSMMMALIGRVFMILAFGSSVWMACMIGCNLYYKKNPQRLVRLNGK